ncbi:hypothetical protein [Streptomyces sp. NPDC020747]|uniref:hypothetical protein n=1 Tax=Streptomyces sp. NPDC020747 TaxID=3365086 RepID=UPI0037A3E242
MPKFTAEQRAAIAAEYDGYADGREQVAADLESKGHSVAAEFQRDLASDYRDVSDAARASSSALNRIY